MTSRAVLFDIDGTLALRTGDRSPYDWHRVGEDEPNPPVIELSRIVHAAGYRLILMSGRDEVCRQQTELWLDAQQVPFHELHMRPEKDNRKDSIVKEELYRKYVEGRRDVAFVVDDRNQVVRMWRELGLSCFQVAEGDF
ncbi:phosphatase domain-containing protein [Paractinoplanes toevensis]|uniref:Polynucleotide kinase PNKP phosphatase domain-containing protein n=1 Tax=Paractinoplanes toevensis TaxID=571911 RepID=A0A919W2N9_9ACTN|nr:hypothetical protein [Actinoplanes toevensis]GIM89705.1 hypothetical protein Ato02nite_014980 [Actinoplanes toevensis]